MVPPTDELNPSAGDDLEEGFTGEGWSWVFWLGCAAALAPTGAAIATVRDVLGNEELQTAYNGGGSPDLEFTDRWALVLALTSLDWPAVASMLGVLALTALVLSGRPQWLLPSRGRLAVGAVAAVCGSWSALTTSLTLHGVLSAPTARELLDEAQGYVRPTLFDVGPGALLSLLVVVAMVCVLLALRRDRPSHARVVEDPPERSQPE